MRSMMGKSAGRLSVALVIAMVVPMLLPVCAVGKGAVEPIVISSFTDRTGSLNINAGKAEGIVVGAKGTILRDGKVIANYEVEQVNWGISKIKVSNLAEGQTVAVGDSAPITGSPTAPVKSADGKKKSSKSKLMWVAAAAGALAIYFLTKGHSSGGSTSTYGVTLEATKTTTFGDEEDSSTVTITATVRDANNNPAPDGTIVTFSSTTGTLSRTEAATVQGKATANLTGNTTDSAAIVTVSSLGKTSTINVSFIASMDIQASPTSIQVTNSGGAQMQSTITATCRDAHGDLATSGTVKFSTTVGTITDSVSIVNGVAATTLTSATAGTATVTATWSGTSASATVNITSGPPYSISVSSDTNSVQCDGNSYATITATVKDVAGNTVANGTVVKFSVTPDATGGGNGSITAQALTSGGIATALLFSRDATGTTSKSGTATVNVRVLVADQPATVPAPANDIVNSATEIQFVSADVADVVVSATPTNISGYDISKKTTITAVVYNADHVPVPGAVTVKFAATPSGRVSPDTATTSNGVATTELSPDGSSYFGPVTVTATAGSPSVSKTTVVIFSGYATQANCSASISSSTLAKLNAVETILVDVKDVNGNFVADGATVNASVNVANVTITSSATTANGRASLQLSTSTDSGNPSPAGNWQATIRIPAGPNPEVVLPVNFTVNP